MTDFDFLILGAGSAGVAAAIKAAELGARVGVVEGGTLGGTCVNVGCVPSKTLIRAAEARHRRSAHPFRGIPHTDGSADWSVVRDEKDALVAELRRAKYQLVLAGHETVRVVRARATVAAGPALVLDDGSTLRADRLLIATGASPWAAPIPGLADAGYLDSTSAMALERLPESLIVIGGSAVGLELAQMFARLGVRVTVLEALPRLVPAEDPAIGDALAGFLAEEGLTVHVGVSARGVERVGEGYWVTFLSHDEGQVTTAEQLLVATGRRANTAGLGLEAAGVALGPKGEVLVDGYLQTTSPGIYAAGDVLGDPMFVYVAAFAGNTAAENALGGNSRRYDLTALPRVSFTDPAVASVGLTEAEAAERGVVPLVSVLPMTQVPRALAARDTRGFVKLVADPTTRRLLGAHALAPEAGEMVMEPALAIRHGLTIDDLTAAFHPYLTLGEAIKLAAQTFDRDVAKLSCCAA
jgi:mercuric reductase